MYSFCMYLLFYFFTEHNTNILMKKHPGAPPPCSGLLSSLWLLPGCEGALNTRLHDYIFVLTFCYGLNHLQVCLCLASPFSVFCFLLLSCLLSTLSASFLLCYFPFVSLLFPLAWLISIYIIPDTCTCLIFTSAVCLLTCTKIQTPEHIRLA